MVHHPHMLPRERVRSSRSHEEKESPSGPDLTKVSSQTTPTLHVALTPTTAVPNDRSVTWEGRTGWKDRYFDRSRDSPRVLPGGNDSPSPHSVNGIDVLEILRSIAPGFSTAHVIFMPVRPHSFAREITQTLHLTDYTLTSMRPTVTCSVH